MIVLARIIHLKCCQPADSIRRLSGAAGVCVTARCEFISDSFVSVIDAMLMRYFIGAVAAAAGLLLAGGAAAQNTTSTGGQSERPGKGFAIPTSWTGASLNEDDLGCI